MVKEPVARGCIVPAGPRHKEASRALAGEATSILRALDAPSDAALAEADYVLLLVESAGDVPVLELPDLTTRAAAAVGLAEDAGEGRVAVLAARKRLRAQGATLGSRELVFTPSQFGYLGLESDGARERLEILLRALVLDAERLRLRREGWEEP